MNDTDIILHLPFPPSSRKYYIKGRILSKAGRDYRKKVAEDVHMQVGNLHIDYKIHFETILYMPDNRIRDLDNYLKALQDALTKCKFWEDDNLINQGTQYRGQVLKPGKVVCRITEAGPVLPDMSDPFSILD